MLRFDFNIVYVPGKNLVIADTLSRAPLRAPDQHDKHLQEDVQAYVDAIFKTFQKWPGTVEKVGQRKDELRVWLNDIIQYRPKYQL